MILSPFWIMHDYDKQELKAKPPEEAQNIETLVKFDL